MHSEVVGSGEEGLLASGIPLGLILDVRLYGVPLIHDSWGQQNKLLLARGWEESCSLREFLDSKYFN